MSIKTIKTQCDVNDTKVLLNKLNDLYELLDYANIEIRNMKLKTITNKTRLMLFSSQPYTYLSYTVD